MPVGRVRKKKSPPKAGKASLCLDMQIQNFGPIKKASISLRPLTVFIGPSNTGKSYAAMLVHSIVSSGSTTGLRPYPLINSRHRIARLEKLLVNIRQALRGLELGKPRECPPSLAAQIGRFCRYSFAEKIQSEIERNFGSPLAKMARFNARRLFMSLECNGERIITYGSRGMNLNCIRDPKIRFEVTKSARRGLVHVSQLKDGVLGCVVHRDLVSGPISPGFRDVYERIEQEVLQNAGLALPTTSQYFPAGRTGILQAHRVISSGIIRSAPYGGNGNIEIPRLTGVVSDFVSDIIEMRPQPGQYHEQGKKIELDVLKGQIRLKPSVGDTAPELVYKHRIGVNLPMRLTSSAISELAPLMLYVKYAGRNNDMLVIEEPEAHLHPRTQRLFARHLVRLVKSGINVTITTHSAIFLEVISQCLQAYDMTPKDRNDILGDEGLYLGINEVAPHLFYHEQNDAAFVKKIPMSTDEGISQEEFIKVDHLLNIDNIRIEEHRIGNAG